MQKGTAKRRRVAGLLLILACLAITIVSAYVLRSGTERSAPKPPALPAGLAVESDELVYSRYAGSASCQHCHAREYTLWSRSHHALAERGLDHATDGVVFDPGHALGEGPLAVRAFAAENAFRVEALGLSGAKETHAIERVIGVHPLRQFMVPASGGRLQVLEAAWDPARAEWFNVYGSEDRRPGEWGHWTGRGMNWNSMCAACHNTRLRKHYDPSTDSYATTRAEMGVGCEACHGPLAEHVRAAEAGERAPAGAVSDARLAPSQAFEACGACHARRRELTGEFVPGDSFFDHYALMIPDATDAYYPDGQVRDEVFEFASFLGSGMHNAGVRCLDCHDPHSGERLTPGNQTCMRCHGVTSSGAPVIDPGPHSFHAVDGPGGQCVDCHMPLTSYMQRHPRRDHGFTIPDPLLTIEHGVPNACNRCHADHDAQWALDAVEKWYGKKMQRPTRLRARAIARARTGDDSARDALLEVLAAEKIPYWKAVEATLLERWVADPRVAAALVNLVTDADPLVRERAVFALERRVPHDKTAQAAARARLDDPLRSVRVQAAWALRQVLDPRVTAAADLARAIAQESDQPVGVMHAGHFALARGDLDPALARFRKAVEWDPNSAPFRHELAIALSQKGDDRAALAQMQAACRIEPKEPEFRLKLAMAYNDVGDLGQAIASFEEALQLDPRNARAAYGLGLVRNAAGQPERALDDLMRAALVDPRDAQIPYARATILARLGRVEEARVEAQRAVDLDPSSAEARGLVQALRP